MQLHTKGKPTIPHTNHNQTMVISIITSIVEMSHMEIISRTPDRWQDSLHYLRQPQW